jgi:3-keto-disaccharide hydrolase
MKFLLIALACLPLAVTAQAPNTLTNAEKKEGWQLLFDGSDTKGWHAYGLPTAGRWIVQNGAFAPGTAGEGHGDLVTNGAYGDFDLKLEWKISPGGNSGILFYVQEDTAKYKETYFTGPEMQVLDNDSNHDGRIKTHRAGNLYDLIAGPDETKPVGQWNQVEIISKGGELKLFLNGVNVVTTTMWNDHWRDMIAHSKFKRWKDFGVAHSGKIALQYHDFPVWFRNIKIKKL